MIHTILLFSLCLCHLVDELESVSVTEGDSLTLHHNLSVSNIQRNDEIEWRFEGTRIARVIVKNSEYYDENTFKDRLKLDQTGSLTITNTRTTDSGLYQLKTIIGLKESIKRFNVKVYDVEKLPVTVGDSLTLNPNLTNIQRNDEIEWRFEGTRIARVIVPNSEYYDENTFKDRLKLDHQTGSLTITNTRTTDSGLYQLKTIIGFKESIKIFNVTVYAPLPIPVITRDSSQCSSSLSSSSSQQNCSLLCSVENVGDVTLSWYKGNSLLSSISVSDLSISLSLPLEVKYQDNNSYSCVINNPITNQTTHLDISKLCHTCSAPGLSAGHIALVCFSVLAVVLVLCGIFCGIFFYYHHRRSTQADHQSKPYGEENIRLTNADGETLEQERHLQNNNFVEKDEIKSVIAMVGERVTLHTDLTEIKEDELIRWKFADSKIYKFAEFFVIAKWDKTNNEEYLHDDHKFKDRLHLDHNTGSLIITNITPKHYGHYKLHITSEGRDISKTFNLVAHDPKKRPGTILRRETCP